MISGSPNHLRYVIALSEAMPVRVASPLGEGLYATYFCKEASYVLASRRKVDVDAKRLPLAQPLVEKGSNRNDISIKSDMISPLFKGTRVRNQMDHLPNKVQVSAKTNSC